MFERFGITDNQSFFSEDFAQIKQIDLAYFLENLKLHQIIWLVLDDSRSFIYSPDLGYMLLEPLEVSTNWEKLISLNNNIIVWDYKNWLKNLGLGSLQVQPFDTQLAAYLLNQGKAEDFASVFQAAFEENFPTLEKKYEESDLIEYLKKMAYALDKLHLLQRQMIRDWQMEVLFYEIEMPLTKILAEMESIGVLADKSKLDDLNESMNAEISDLESQIYAYADEPFNINSSKQLSNVLLSS